MHQTVRVSESVHVCVAQQASMVWVCVAQQASMVWVRVGVGIRLAFQ